MVESIVLVVLSLLVESDGTGAVVALQLASPIRILYLVTGIALLTTAIVDLLWTTLWADGGAGPLSSKLTMWIWRGLKTVGGQRSRAVSLAGPLILVFTIALWIVLIWAGWTFVFASSENTLIDTLDQGPIGWTERIYFVAYTMFTLGNGDFAPADGVWQIITALTTASGMLSVTFTVTYVLSVIGAVVEKRSFASTVTGVGNRSEAFVRAGWNGDDFHELDLPLNTLASDLSRLAKQHKAYPILHYYHSQQAQDSAPMAVAIFDEALTLLHVSIRENQQPSDALVRTAQSSVQSYLQTLSSAFIQPADEAPSPPDLDRLRDADIPTVSDEELDDALEDLNERRRKLLGAVYSDAWYWPPINDE